MGCSPDKPQKPVHSLVIIEGEWEGILAVGPAPGVDHKGLLNKNGLKQIIKKLKNFYQIDFIVSLLESKQMRELGLKDEFSLIMAAGIGVAVYPIVDQNIPAKLPEFRNLVIKIVEQYLKKGKRVLVHCKHGKGRSGLFVAACLVYKGYNRFDAIKMTRKWIPNAMQEYVQQYFITNMLTFS